MEAFCLSHYLHAKPLFPFLLLILHTLVGAAIATDFCSKTLATTSCPTPPTVDSLQLKNYLGVFYMIGATAHYKFKSENGLICTQANYTYATPLPSSPPSDVASNISVLNSGAQIVGSQTIAAVARISAASSAICSKARRMCSAQAPNNRIPHSLALISSTQSLVAPSNPSEAASLREIEESIRGSFRTVSMHLDAIARGVTQIQVVTGRVNQGVGSVTSELESLREAVEKTTSESKSIGSVAIDTLTISRSKLVSLADNLPRQDAESIRQAASLLEEEMHQISDDLSKIDGQLTSIGGPLATLISADDESNGHHSKLTNLKISKGQVIQSDPKQGGKMKLSLGKTTLVPYEIIALEGEPNKGYEAALVYSCTMDSDGHPNEDLYLLSRTREMPHDGVDHLVDMARGYGISTDCDSPFITTIQKGGDCGTP